MTATYNADARFTEAVIEADPKVPAVQGDAKLDRLLHEGAVRP